MKRQMSLLLSSVVGAMTLTPIAIAQVHPLIAVEKSSQGRQPMAKGSGGSIWSQVENLDLTAAQQAEIDAIQAELTEQMAEILTPEQMETFAAAQANGNDMSSSMMSLDITRSQTSGLMSAMSTARDNIMDVLTPEQQAQIDDLRPRDRN